MPDPRRRLPSVDAMLRSDPGTRLSERFGREVTREAIRFVIDGARSSGSADPADAEGILSRAATIAARMSLGLSEVLNATGVILHTNLGRAPLPREAIRAVVRTARGYADLEVERETGTRGRRTTRIEFLLRSLTGAEGALAVNNNAAAVLLALAALARRREVLVSRGELIEIGGEFRLPDIMAASGAKLVEVGTTNRTRLEDYRRAMSPRTALVLVVHPSNFRVVGFSQTPPVRDLAGLARGAGVPLLYDIGSGLLRRTRGIPREEPAASQALATGADLVCFSGDKLLGGPQAGIVLGSAVLVERLRRHPIARAVRPDKMTVAALEAVLRLYATSRTDEMPVWRSVTSSLEDLGRRARNVAVDLPGASAVRSASVVGGGSLPGYDVPTYAVRLPHARPEQLAARLRVGNPSVFSRVEGDAVLFDLRTVDPEDDARLARAARYALSQEP